MKNLFVINFKTYESATGVGAVSLARQCAASAVQGVQTIVCVQATDISRVSSAVSLPVFGQHVDPAGFGAHTGAITPQALKAAGAAGTLLNHSEDRYPLSKLKLAILAAKAQGLYTIVCAHSPALARAIAQYAPDCIAYEPPDLIGGDVSVVTRPKSVSHFVSMVRRIDPTITLLVGAGVKTSADVSAALRLGAHGVLLASGITQAKDVSLAMKEYGRGYGTVK